MTDRPEELSSGVHDYFDNRLAPAERSDLEDDLEGDPQLRQQLDELQQIGAALRELPDHQLDEGFADQVLSQDSTQLADAVWTSTDELVTSRRRRVPAWAQAISWVAVAAALMLAISGFWPAGDVGPASNPADIAAGGNSDSPDVDPDNDLPGTGPAIVTDQPGGSIGPDAVGPGTVQVEISTGNKFLFVMEIGITPEGAQKKVIDTVLMKHGIIYDNAIQVDVALEKSLLETRFLDGIVPKPSDPKSEDQEVELVYLVCSGRQVDEMTADLHGRHGEVAAYRFNLAILPGDIEVFGDLEKAIASQWDSPDRVEDNKPALAGFQNRAGRLLMDLVLISGMGRQLSTSVLSVDNEVPEPPPSGSKRGELKLPAPKAGGLGDDLVCEMLLVVRRMSQEEADKLNQKQDK